MTSTMRSSSFHRRRFLGTALGAAGSLAAGSKLAAAAPSLPCWWQALAPYCTSMRLQNASWHLTTSDPVAVTEALLHVLPQGSRVLAAGCRLQIKDSDSIILHFSA
jgi:hypothetical protein